MRALVTGGGGFLGTRIVEMLHARGDDVTALGRNRYPHLDRLGIATVAVDLRDADAVRRVVAGFDVVFHVAAVAGIWGPPDLFWDINAGGTANILGSCRANGINKLVYTSSPSVVFGGDDLCGVDEAHPYPRRHLADYPKSKAVAERMVLKANRATLATVALRPHLIWGPGDPHLIPRVMDRARRGRLVRVGDGRNLVDITYIDNAAEAHLMAADALEPGSPCAGKAYFISQGEPVRLWSWLGDILEAAGAPPVKRSVSFPVADRIGAVLEFVYRTGRIQREPPMTRFLAAQMAKSHYFSIEAARRDFGFAPRISTQEGQRFLLDGLRGRTSEPTPMPLVEVPAS
ncbi:MAG: NAD-dependent epimerase/dehydratase family protein [Phycisphaerae bacterium]